jgi:hypothetical protein
VVAVLAAARRFPLVPRPRPTCRSLADRIRELHHLADVAANLDHEPAGSDRLAMAAQVLNKASLIASDCGLPDLARSLCWQRFTVYQHAQPLDARAARHALEPLVNLARLLARAGAGEQAHHLLAALYHAVRHRTDTTIAGIPVTFTGFFQTEADQQAVHRWLWTVLLADGTRALTAAGNWCQAAAHAERHGGVGARLLDGRQAAIIARSTTGATATARTMLDQTTTAEPWEQAVAACLHALIQAIDDRPTGEATAGAVGRYRALDHESASLIFRTRLGLTILDLAGTDQPELDGLIHGLVRQAAETPDGYAARDLLADTRCRTLLSAAEARELSAVVDEAGLGAGNIPRPLLADLMAAIHSSEQTTMQELARRSLRMPAERAC